MPSYLRNHLLLWLPFRLLSVLPTLMLLFLDILKQIRVIAEAKVAKVNFTPMTLMALLTPMFAWHFPILSHMPINEASLVVVEGNQLLDITTVASLAILLSSAMVT